MGLIARALEEAGIATVSLTSAHSITAAVGVPRGVFIDYPLGQTAGRANAAEEQELILESACQAFEDAGSPGDIRQVPLVWPGDAGWKDAVMRPEAKDQEAPDPNQAQEQASHASLRGDQRVERYDSPQYQLPDDAVAAEPNCSSCVFLTPEP